MDHSGRIPEDTFLKILPDTIEDYMSYMKMVVSIQLGTGPHFAVARGDGTTAGTIEVSRIDRFCLRQKITLVSDTAPATDFYVIAIDVNTTRTTGTITVSATRDGAAADVSAFTAADNTQFFTDDADQEAFTSIRSVLLSPANGGASTVHGVSKLSSPFLQAINIDGTGWTQANILDSIFDAYTAVRQKAKGMADRVIMSYENLGAVLKRLQNQGNLQGHYQLSEQGRKASVYGWDEICVTSVKGTLKIVGIQEWDDDIVAFLDMKSMVFRSNGFFKKRKNPEGHEFFEVRNQTGYQYIVDTCLFGELEINKPGHNAIVYGIPSPLPVS